MKITAFDDLYPSMLVVGGTVLEAADGSNSGWTGGDVVGDAGDLSVVRLRSTVSLGSNLGTGVAVGDVLTIIDATSKTARFATPSNSSIGSNALLRTTGGAGAVTTIAASGSATTLMVGGANTFDITLTASCTLSLSGAAASGSESSVLLILRQDGVGSRLVTWPGSVTWAGGSAPTLSTTASTADFVVLETVDGGTTWFGFPVGGNAGTTSPLTTKGDLYTYTTTNARLAVGSNGTGLVADPNETTGLRWTLRAPSGEILVADTPSGLPIAFADLVTNEIGSDLAYGDM